MLALIYLAYRISTAPKITNVNHKRHIIPDGSVEEEPEQVSDMRTIEQKKKDRTTMKIKSAFKSFFQNKKLENTQIVLAKESHGGDVQAAINENHLELELGLDSNRKHLENEK